MLTTAVSSPASATTNSQLDGVACATQSSCFAVGYVQQFEPGEPDAIPLVRHWNGSGWVTMTSPTPTGAVSAWLADIACAGPTRCVAVGAYSLGDVVVGFAEHWNGTAWTIRKIKNPGGSTDVTWRSTTCTSPTNCFAVGNATIGARNLPAIARWNGTAWTSAPGPAPSGSKEAILFDVACPTATSCVAVGANGVHPMVERWNGAKWALAAAPGSATQRGQLYSVACPALATCFAVGAIFNSDGNATARLTARWNGTRWTLTTRSSPPQPTLFGVACASTTHCFAVGSGQGQYPHKTLVERWDGSQWKVVSSPNSPGALANALVSVSCPKTTSCIAVGVRSTADSFTGLAERWNGTRWSISSTGP